MKKIFAIVLSILLVAVVFAGCSKKNTGGESLDSELSTVINDSEQGSEEKFSELCSEVQEKIRYKEDKISADELNKIFIDLNKYLLIPHYDKEPNVEKGILTQLKNYILCGEASLVPVLFSDYRPSDNDGIMPLRQTYFDIDEISISSVKKALLSKKHVTLSEEEGNSLFNVLPELRVSTGLNVVIGERSSGKT